LRDGAQKVIGLWCYLPSTGAGEFQADLAKCRIAPIDDWREGHAPPPTSP